MCRGGGALRGRCVPGVYRQDASRGVEGEGVRRQSACATLTLKTPRNVRVRAPETSECVRRSVRNVRVRAPIHARVCVWLGVDRVRGEGEMSVTEDVSPSGEGLCCGVAQAL